MRVFSSALVRRLRALVLKNLVVLLIAAGATMLAACASEGPPDAAAPVIPAATPIQLPFESSLDRQRNDLVNEAILLATVGCPGLDERLSGPPTRILAALSNSSYAGGLINPEAGFRQLGPGGSGAVTVWVLAIEGSSVPIVGEDPWNGSNVRAYFFVADAFNPRLTGCVLRDAPTTLKYPSSRVLVPGAGVIHFEVLLDTR